MNDKIFKKVAEICNNHLLSNDEVLLYLNNRGINQKSINKFQIGLFPKNLKILFDELDPKELRLAGIIRNISESKFHIQDLVVPIRDVYGNYVALAGRTRLTDEERKKRNIAKYMNTPYSKRNHLFGMNFAKKYIIKYNAVYVVEGYFDVISPHQYNFNNVVAVCGAYLTLRHFALLARYTNHIILLFDNEPEAIERAKRTVERRKQEDLIIEAVNIFPKNIKDLDEYLKTYSIKDLRVALDGYDIEPIW